MAVNHPIASGNNVQFGQWTVIEKRGRCWLCRCKCGAIKEVHSANLTSGRSKSCGCTKKTHELSDGPEFMAWCQMIQRCHNPRSQGYRRYGARGICVCDEWRGSFQAFIDHIGLRPSKDHSIDRIDNDRSYEPGNVRWATRSEQQANRQCITLYDFRGERLCLAEIARLTGVPYGTITKRVKRGISVEQASNGRVQGDHGNVSA